MNDQTDKRTNREATTEVELGTFRPHGLAHAIAVLARPFRAAGRRFQARRTDRQALSLNDRVLNDIGMPRTQVLAMVYGPKPTRRMRHANA